ncbi:hypothetical protein Bca52824_012440 [Brassica carinata]|uniref:BAT2 N-terminal domain-containing protein n=1 Tax=Brassica carinata TaxID=52824 RepID=A0A8X8B303_BRACI|nr:hypothetical protein Bca52824_012440 [Brassica carinata]
MASSSTGDRSRWGTTRRSGMTILGKVAVPKPINLPSQRLENQGLDPNVEIVPKGTLSWGSKSSLNAWGTSSLSPRTESGPGSPSHLSNRPSSGGSVTRPSTADSDKAHDSSSVGWDPNSRPSSASGVFPSNQASVALQRPHSADTRPGSSQLSRFAEAVSETPATWGQHGVAPAKKDGFSLTSGDFPSLGAEKESSEKSATPQDAGPRTRPASSSGRSVEEREANVRIGDDNAWRRDNQPYSEDAPRYCREEGQLDSRGLQSYPNANFPHQYDAWRGPPVNNHQGGGWYRGNQPYGAPMGPGGFHVDPFPFYPTQVPPVPGHEAGPRGNPTTNGKMFRPPMLDPYVHPRPGFYLGPVPHEGYYGPPIGYGGPSNRDLPFPGRPAGPHAYHQHSGQGGYDTSASSVALERMPSHSQERQYKILLKPQDERLKEDEAKREEFLGNRPSTAEKAAPQMQTSKNNRRVNNNETSGEVQPIKAENATRVDPSLIQKIEGLNAKTTLNSGTSANKVSARMPRSGHASDGKNSLHYRQGDPATNKNAELAAISGTTISRRSTQHTQGGADHQAKQRVNTGGNDGWRKTAVMSGSSAVTLAPNSERFAEVNEGDSLDTIPSGSLGLEYLWSQRQPGVKKVVLGHNSDMPAASSVSTESTYEKKNNRNGKKKHRVEETTAMNPTRATVGKDSKSGDESTEIGRERAPEMEFGSLSVPSLDIKVSGNSSDQISSFTNEESQSRVKHNWKSQHLRRNPRNSVANKPAEKFAGSSTVIWAPVHPQQKADISTDADSQKTVPEFSTSSKSLHQVQTSSKSKRVEMERYVAKPIVKEMAEQSVSKNPITTAPEMTENVLQKENCGGEGTGILQPSVSAAGKSGSPSKSRHGNGRQGKHGRDHGSPHQRGSVASTKALEDGQFRGTVNYHRNNQTEQIAVGSSKDHTTCKSDGWNDGWYVPPETHSSAAEEVEANGPGTVAVGKDQGMSIHGKQHASRSYKDGGSNYSDPKRANKRDSGKAHMQQSGHGLGQPDLPVASKESRGPEDNVAHTPNVNRGGSHGGREYTRDKTYVSQKRDVAGYGHQRFTSEQKMTSAETPAQSHNRSITKEVQGEHHPNSMLGSSAQENMHHHHQRPPSNRDHRQKQNLHYEYKPVGSHTHDGEQQFKERLSGRRSTKIQGERTGAAEAWWTKDVPTGGSSAGRNTGHGITDNYDERMCGFKNHKLLFNIIIINLFIFLLAFHRLFEKGNMVIFIMGRLYDREFRF